MDAAREARLRESLAAEPRVVFAYLFGSQATGGAGPRSDVDVAAWLAETVSDDARLDLVALVGSALRSDAVDAVVLNRAPLTLAAEVLRGRLLVSKDEDVRVSAEAGIMRRYHDRRASLRRYLESEGRRLAERGWS